MSPIFDLVNITYILYFVGFCPIFTSDGYLDWKQCNNSEPSCPNRSYVSNEVYKCKNLSVYILFIYFTKKLVQHIKYVDGCLPSQ